MLSFVLSKATRKIAHFMVHLLGCFLIHSLVRGRRQMHNLSDPHVSVHRWNT